MIHAQCQGVTPPLRMPRYNSACLVGCRNVMLSVTTSCCESHDRETAEQKTAMTALLSGRRQAVKIVTRGRIEKSRVDQVTSIGHKEPSVMTHCTTLSLLVVSLIMISFDEF